MIGKKSFFVLPFVILLLCMGCGHAEDQKENDTEEAPMEIKQNSADNIQNAITNIVGDLFIKAANGVLEIIDEPPAPKKPEIPPLEDCYYIMPIARQKYILKTVPTLQLGMSLNEVLKILGEPFYISYSTDDGVLLDSANYDSLERISVQYAFRRVDEIISNNRDQGITLFFDKEKNLRDIYSDIRGISRGAEGDSWEKWMIEKKRQIPWEPNELTEAVHQGQDYELVTHWGNKGPIQEQLICKQINAVATDLQDNVYVSIPHVIKKYDHNGKFIKEFGGYGKEDGQFNQPLGIDVDKNGYVYVADNGNTRVQKFDSDGNFISKWGSKGEQDGQFRWLCYVAIDSKNNVYTIDSTANIIQKFDSDGNFILKWSIKNEEQEPLKKAIKIDIDNNDYVYVTYRWENAVLKYSKTGDYLGKIYRWSEDKNDRIVSIWGAKTDSEGCLYAIDHMKCRIIKFSPDGEFITKWNLKRTAKGYMFVPEDIAIDSKNNVYVGARLDYLELDNETGEVIEKKVRQIQKYSPRNKHGE